MEHVVSSALEPPAALVEKAIYRREMAAFWLRPSPFAVRCIPPGGRATLLKLVVPGGRVRLEQGGRCTELEDGQCAWFEPQRSFRLRSESGSLLLLRIERSWIDRDWRDREVLLAAPLGGHDALARHLAARVLTAVRDSGPGLSAAGRQSAFDTAMAALPMLLEHRSLEGARVDRAAGEIRQRLHDPGLTASDVARAQGVSRRYLDQLFVQAKGCSMTEFLREQRLLLAADLLEREPLSAREVAFRCGFRDASHFGRAFAKRFGVTPGGWPSGRTLTRRQERASSP